MLDFGLGSEVPHLRGLACKLWLEKRHSCFTVSFHIVLLKKHQKKSEVSWSRILLEDYLKMVYKEEIFIVYYLYCGAVSEAKVLGSIDNSLKQISTLRSSMKG